ncbi:hypothetical protein CCP2SC5_730001 [Azospirillaceae bacterium]
MEAPRNDAIVCPAESVWSSVMAVSAGEASARIGASLMLVTVSEVMFAVDEKAVVPPLAEVFA